jgi:phosphoribosylaminoimidazolecarboxamide formyltransferase / IMP cyclohydrolase
MPEMPLALRKQCAAKAFARCAAYDTLISSWLSGVANDVKWPAYLLDAQLAQPLRYGENPHQAAALYTRMDAKGGIANATQLQGKELSYNNLADADAAWAMVSTLEAPSAVLIKHANPCGVASGPNITAAFTAALASDPVSAFGGILAVNRAVDASLVNAIGSLFLEVFIAPEFSPEAREMLGAKKNLRLLVAAPEAHASPLSHSMVHAISGGYLLQQQDETTSPISEWKTESGGTVSDAQMGDASLAWHVVKYVKSNAIVLVKNGATIGVGAGRSFHRGSSAGRRAHCRGKPWS